ncbi:Rrp15p-domain-containing protein [Apiospora kogelbergensis]|uniref:Rrp15p-domain-containing protein n=1 Tax=Apiospora kogelbergensis TaxID=1337665 RepID=UPI0031301C29
MAGPNAKKRSHQEYSLKGRMKAQRPLGKYKKQKHYHSDSDEDDEKPTEPNKSFKPVDLMDSEDDLDNAVRRPKQRSPKAKKTKQAEEHDKDSEESDSEDEELEENDEFDIDLEDDSDAEDNDDDDDDTLSTNKKPKSKRNDPGAFATSLSKILSTKLPTTRRADPVLSRSVDAHKASQAITDSVLEGKAKKQLRVQKLAALEKGRVRNVLVASRNEATGELEATTGQVMEKERQLRKVAQRGVVKLFNAVRAAQVRGVEAEREARKDGFVGVSSRKDKVTDMSKKGFLDLIASGGGDLKKGPIEEA